MSIGGLVDALAAVVPVEREVAAEGDHRLGRVGLAGHFEQVLLDLLGVLARPIQRLLGLGAFLA
jgi:hypothetical protein